MKFPEQLYVARKYVSSERVEAMVTDATKTHTKAFETKKERLDSWASKAGSKELPSIFIENKPTIGFSIVKMVYSYNRDTFFTVRHPEGFEFYIPASNMNDLIANNDIIKGVFQAPLYFNDKMELINESTSLFEKMKKEEEKQSERKDFVQTLKVGDGFTYKDNDYYYCGRVHAICMMKSKEYSIPEKSSLYHLVYNISKKHYVLNTKLDKYTLAPKALLNTKTTIDKEIAKANAEIYESKDKLSDYLSDSLKPIVMAEKPFKKTSLKIRYEKIDVKDIFNKTKRFNSDLIYKVHKDGQDYRVFVGLKATAYDRYSYNRNDYSLIYYGEFDVFAGTEVDIDENGIMTLDVDLDKHSSFGSWNGYQSPFYPPTKKYSSSNSYADRKQMVHLSTDLELFVSHYYL